MSHRHALALTLAVVLLIASGCGGSRDRRGDSGRAGAVAQAPRGPALGLTEDNANLLWSPTVRRSDANAAFAAARAKLTALKPAYVRLLVDWAALQPRAGAPPALEATVDGCARGVGPCEAYAGLRDQLAAIASQQRAASGHSFQVVFDIFGAPAWAALAPSGCEARATSSFARPLRPDAIASYRALIDSLSELAAHEGVRAAWWSPWNEPNDPRFISPQRAACEPGARLLAPSVYAQLATAMAQELATLPGSLRLVMGELNDLTLDSPHSTSIASFVAALPQSVMCLADAWSIHAYAARYAGAPSDAVGDLEQALDRRGDCARAAPIWVTEAGAGATHPGAPRAAGEVDERAGCEALARQLQRWYGDPRVAAVLQYSFREDPAFPVGLLGADLTHEYPAYRLWLRAVQARAAALPPPSPTAGCA